ncbi:MAG: nucleotide pyrophosphohydrolase [Euryarchaeota archaeon]|nr:nucleotide pyrophosphohydrolase [Euryarchaeota archaeon]MCD6158500.1 nucleotide pyrophosphohydrolase [Euryarchaeota archaeon]
MASIKDLTERIVNFRDKREWKKYHTPKNLALSLVVEVGELLELLQWMTDEEILKKCVEESYREKLEEELADVAIYLFLLSHELNIDLERAIAKKIRKNEEKYPVDKVKGIYKKYTEL